jgi:hypothetical protein
LSTGEPIGQLAGKRIVQDHPKSVRGKWIPTKISIFPEPNPEQLRTADITGGQRDCRIVRQDALLLGYRNRFIAA